MSQPELVTVSSSAADFSIFAEAARIPARDTLLRHGESVITSMPRRPLESRSRDAIAVIQLARRFSRPSDMW